MQHSAEAVVEMINRYPFGEAAETSANRQLVKLNRRFKEEEADEIRGKVEFHSKLKHPALIAIVKAFQSRQARFFDVFFQYVPKGLRQCNQTLSRAQLQLIKNQLRDLCAYLIGMNIYPEVAQELIGVDAQGNAKLYLDVDFRVLKPKQNKGELVKVKYVEIEEVVGQYERQMTSSLPVQHKQAKQGSSIKQLTVSGSTKNTATVVPTLLTSRSQEPLIRFNYLSPPRTRYSQVPIINNSNSISRQAESRTIFTQRKSHPLPKSNEPLVNVVPMNRTVAQSVSPQAKPAVSIGKQVARRVTVNPPSQSYQLQQRLRLNGASQQPQNLVMNTTSRTKIQDMSNRNGSPNMNVNSRHMMTGRASVNEPTALRTASGIRMFSVTDTKSKSPVQHMANSTPVRRICIENAISQVYIPEQQQQRAQQTTMTAQPKPEVAKQERKPERPIVHIKKNSITEVKTADAKEHTKITKLLDSNGPSPSVSQPDSPTVTRHNSKNNIKPEDKPQQQLEAQLKPVAEQPAQENLLNSKFSHGLPAIALTISHSLMISDDHLVHYQSDDEADKVEAESSKQVVNAAPEVSTSKKSKKSSNHPNPQPQSSRKEQPNSTEPTPKAENTLQHYQQPRHQPPIVINIIAPSEHEGNRLIDFARSITQHSLDTYFAEIGDAQKMPRIKITELRQTTQSPPKIPNNTFKGKLHESVGINNGKALLDRRNEIAENEDFPDQSSQQRSNPFKRKVNRLDRIPDEPESPTEALHTGFGKQPTDQRHNSGASKNRRDRLYQMAQNYLVEPNRQPYEQGKGDYRLINMYPLPEQPDNALAKELNILFDQQANENNHFRPVQRPEQLVVPTWQDNNQSEVIYNHEHHIIHEQQQQKETSERLQGQLEGAGEDHQMMSQTGEAQQHYEEEEVEYEEDQYMDNQEYAEEAQNQQHQEEVDEVNDMQQGRSTEQRRHFSASDSTCQNDPSSSPTHFPRVRNDEINQRVMQALKKSEAMLDFFNKFKQRRLEQNEGQQCPDD